jgi:hypothetical protein
MDPMTRHADPLDDRLRSLAREAAWPTTPDVTEAVLARVRAGAGVAVGQAPRRRSPIGRSWRVVALALLALVIAAAVAGAALFGLPGLRLGTVEVLPSPQVVDDPQAIRRWLGAPSDLAGARALLGADLRVPQALGEPDEVHVRDIAGRTHVALVYHAEPGAPVVADGLGLIITEWMGGFDEDFARKWLQERGGHAEVVDVDGSRGYWVSGLPHVLEYLDDEAGMRRTPSRLVGDVLVWQTGAVVYRIESPRGRDATLDIAASMR